MSKVDNYTFLSVIGSGTYGEVWRAHDKIHDRVVAIKKMNNVSIDYFKKEKRILQYLSNTRCKNLPIIYDWFKEGKVYYIVMQFIKGHTLISWAKIKQNHRVLNLTYLNMCTSLSKAIQCLHDNGFSHRDIKLDNVIWTGKTVSDAGYTTLVDFGISCDQRWFAWNDRCGDTANIGTPFYMAPELVEQKVDDYFKVDIFAFGVLIYMLFNNDMPLFPGNDASEVLENIMLGNHVFVSTPWKELKNLVLAMVQYDPAKRPSIHVVKNVLERVMNKYNPTGEELATIKYGKPVVQKKRKGGKKRGKK